MKSKKGITLISLVITVVVLVILASVGIYSGVDMINSSKLTAFEVELRIMQSTVNDLYDKYTDNKTVTVDSIETNILELGQDISDSNISSNASAALDGAEVANDETIRADYRYFTQDYLEKLGVEGINQDFLVNVKSRKVVSYLGFKYKETRYYTLEQVTDNVYNVEYNNQNTGKPTFDVDYERIDSNKWQINVSNIQYENYINKWQIEYKLGNNSYWATTEDLNFIVNEPGSYNIKLSNGEIESEEKTLNIVFVNEP